MLGDFLYIIIIGNKPTSPMCFSTSMYFNPFCSSEINAPGFTWDISDSELLFRADSWWKVKVEWVNPVNMCVII